MKCCLKRNRKPSNGIKNWAKSLTDNSLKRKNKRQKSKWKYAHHMSSKKCKAKQEDITTHSLEWPKPKTLTIPNAGGDVEQPELWIHSLMETIESSTTTWQFLANLFLKSSTILLLYRSYSHSFPNLQIIKMFFIKWMEKQSVIYRDNRMFSRAKKNKAMQRYGGNLNVITK